jgi:signal transduction histidine kinase
VAERGKILVVDDNRVNRLTLSRSLEAEGHQVALAEEGQQALDLLYQEPFEVVLLDILMPGLDGYQTLGRIKADPELCDIPVIVISALDELDSAVRCIEMGAEDYLSKPFNPVLLRARLGASLQRKKLRDLEKAFLQQEFALRQNEKLATLGRLSAGMAHELNNPAAAAQRGAAQMQIAFARLQETLVGLGHQGLSGPQWESLGDLDRQARAKVQQPLRLEPLETSDRTVELEDWLEDHQIENAWEVAPNLVNLGYRRGDLESLSAPFTQSQLPALMEWLNCTYVVYNLLEEIGTGSRHISEIVKALKTYSYLDQAPLQSVNLHEGLDSTLVMLHSRLKQGVTVHRQYDPNLPTIQAYGSELNQVWTNLIENAIDAMNGQGSITLRTRHDGQWVIVEVEDDGPGISAEVQSRVFDPFFTTKPPGKGIGMGLNISHNTVVQKHQGRLEVFSQPGQTRFEVRLPLHLVPAGTA